MVTKVFRSLRDDLVRLIKDHPEARVVTGVGRSAFSGWGDLRRVKYHPKENVIELEFD